MPSTPTRSSVPNEHSQACKSANPAVVVGNDQTPSRPPLASSAAATCTSRWVSTPPVIGRVSTMVIAIPSQFNLVKGWHARPGKETVTIGLRLTDRSITLRNGACPYPTHGPADRHLDILDVPTSQTGPQEPLTVAHRPHEPVDRHQVDTTSTTWDERVLDRPAPDHVMYGVSDLYAATATFEADYQLPVSDGGVHPDGTRNRVVWCADRSYVELIAVDVPTSPQALWVQDEIAAGKRLLGWAIRTDDVVAASERLGLPVVAGSIELPDGRTRSPPRLVGVAAAMAEPWLPFFISYDQARDQLAAPAAAVPDDLAWVEVAGDAGRLRDWVRASSLPVRVVDGVPGVHAVGIARVAGRDHRGRRRRDIVTRLKRGVNVPLRSRPACR